MAKMIKCPTCGTQIEVPPQAAGQIVKCPGCGKGLKLVAKQRPGGGAGAGQAAGAGMSGSPGGSVAGGSVSAMTFVGDAPPQERSPLDDMPSLESNCAVCGRPSDPQELVEDNGRLVCPDCIKGARSGMARPAAGAELFDVAPPYTPPRRGKLIQITPAFIGAAVAALIFFVCSVLLHLEVVKKPLARAGTAQTNNGGGSAGATPAPYDPDTNPAPQPTHAPGETPTSPSPAPTDAAPQAGDPAPTPPPPPGDTASGASPPPTDTAPDSTSPGPGGTTNPAIALNPTPNSVFDFGPDESATKPAEGAGAGTAPPPPPGVAAADPADRGLERLLVGDFQAAKDEFEQARRTYVIGRIGDRLTPKQQMVLEGVAAAAIATGDPDRAWTTLETVARSGRRTRPLALNRAIAAINKRVPTIDQLGQAAADLKFYLDSNPDDEYAANLFGTLLERATAMGRAHADKVAPYWSYLNNYNDRMARGERAGMLKWGTEWLPAEEVKLYRLGRAAVHSGAAEGALTKAARDLEFQNKAVAAAEQHLKRSPDVHGAQKQLEKAKQLQAEAQKKFDEASAAMKYKKPRWLEEFAAVPPEVPLDPAAPAPVRF